MMSYRKIRGSLLGYERKGRFHVWMGRPVPRSAEKLHLVIPLEGQRVRLPLGAKVTGEAPGRDAIEVEIPPDLAGHFDVYGLEDWRPLEPGPRRRERRQPSEFDRDIATIRKALKRLAPPISVVRGRGTAADWIEIWGSGELREFTEEERRALERLGLPYGANSAGVSPEDRKYYVRKAEEILAST
jgi:hypothetical protein